MAIIPFDQLSAWKDPAVAKRLGWYLDVAENRKSAKFRIARTVPVALSLADAPEDALWDELDRLTPVFLARFARIRGTGEAPGEAPPPACAKPPCGPKPPAFAKPASAG